MARFSIIHPVTKDLYHMGAPFVAALGLRHSSLEYEECPVPPPPAPEIPYLPFLRFNVLLIYSKYLTQIST
jgi:hypothetical protein